MIDLAAIMPALDLLFFGVKKAAGGGKSFENSVRSAIEARGLDLCLRGVIKLGDDKQREVDAAVRIGDRLILIECFSYEMPLDFEVGKPSVFEKRKAFVLAKIEQAKSLAECIRNRPKGTNFDVSWAKTIEWRVVSPFVEFAWQIDEPFYDADGMARVLQIRELIDYLTEGTIPAKGLLPKLKEVRGHEPKGARQ